MNSETFIARVVEGGGVIMWYWSVSVVDNWEGRGCYTLLSNVFMP